MSNRLALQRGSQDMLVAELVAVEPTHLGAPARLRLQQAVARQLA